ncbi:MAG: phospho-sugar mutase [Leptospirales bacterium]|nr:phospho-sugar mutase [Leptospirales bacterium]
MNETIKQKIREWSAPPYDEATINEVRRLVDEKNETELADRFYRQLEFGTGGLRGVIGAGTNRINIYTVGMASQGLANYIIANGNPKAGVVIARDSRRMSDTFAREAAMVLAGNGISVHFFSEITPTPLCSFAIRELKAAAGIVVTASHNPPEYNGYKVYWSDGGQIVPPHDDNIIAEVEKINSPSAINKADFEQSVSDGLIKFIGEEMTDIYISNLKNFLFRKEGEKSGLKIVYSPLHGTGYKIVPKVLAHFGFTQIQSEPEQSKPDSSFSTVKSPNPEESAALERSIALAEKIDADIVFATDPDADRMGVAIKDPNGKFILITGNQIGVMLEYYILSTLSESGKLPANAIVMKTIVTSDIQDEVASGFSCHVENVLTGFKWIADKMRTYDEDGSHTFVFGGEESYGYLPVPFVRDKDSISSCCFFADMADRLQAKNISLYDYLDEIYLRFGCYLEGLHSMTLKGMDGLEKMGKIMETFRQSPPKTFDGVNVAEMRDYLNLNTKYADGQKPIDGLPASDVLQFLLEDKSLLTIRPSGTEPKIKFYISVNKKAGKDSLAAVKKELSEKIERLKKNLIETIDA